MSSPVQPRCCSTPSCVPLLDCSSSRLDSGCLPAPDRWRTASCATSGATTPTSWNRWGEGWGSRRFIEQVGRPTQRAGRGLKDYGSGWQAAEGREVQPKYQR